MRIHIAYLEKHPAVLSNNFNEKNVKRASLKGAVWSAVYEDQAVNTGHVVNGSCGITRRPYGDCRLSQKELF